MTDQSADKPVITHCIEHAKTQQSVCAECQKTIPHKSLRVAEIYRKNKKVKKNAARHTWYHFKCWKVPEYLTHVPIEQFRGYPTLNDKDKARVQRVIKQGVGASWKQLMESAKPVKTEEEEEQEQEKMKQKKEVAEDVDMTEALTGIQQKETKKKTTSAEKKTPVDKKKKKTADNKVPIKDKKAKVTKKEAVKAKTIDLPKEDLLELESIAREFKAFKK
ncbi:hypothetical protein A0J61_04524 [Choanephora cucurbitarum]|uniref:PARP-type domain-containing protein n=1 Tax=Choanephora cucurbitarum TaxID=101091 RepID=A0A1C7NF93_9FUNG|nr:hypothetical protein A0J61_04524 [Choanephora cucurbitarum]